MRGTRGGLSSEILRHGPPSRSRASPQAPTSNTRAWPCATSSSGRRCVRRICRPVRRRVRAFLPEILCTVLQRTGLFRERMAACTPLLRRINCARTMRNQLDNLEEAEMNFGQVVSTNVYLDDLSDQKSFDDVYAQYFGPVPPARTTVQQISPTERKPDKDSQ